MTKLVLQRSKDFAVEKYSAAKKFANHILMETRRVVTYGFLGSNLLMDLGSGDSNKISQALDTISKRGKGNYNVAKMLVDSFNYTEKRGMAESEQLRLKLIEMYPHLSQRKQHKIFIRVVQKSANPRSEENVHSLVGQLMLASKANKRVANELVRMAAANVFQPQVQIHFEQVYASLSQKDRANVFKNLVTHLEVFTRKYGFSEQQAVAVLGLLEQIGRKSETTYKDDTDVRFDDSLKRFTVVLDRINLNKFQDYDDFPFLRLACAKVIFEFEDVEHKIQFLVEKINDNATAAFAVVTLSRVEGGLDRLFQCMKDRGTSNFTPALFTTPNKLDRIPLIVSQLPLQIAEPILLDWMNKGDLGTIHALRSLAARNPKTDIAIGVSATDMQVGILIPQQLISKLPECQQSDNETIRLAAIGVGLKYPTTSQQALGVLASDPEQYVSHIRELPLELAEGVLLNWLGRSDATRVLAMNDLMSLGQISPALSAALVQLLSSETEAIKLNAILRCAQFGIKDVIQHLPVLLNTKLLPKKEVIYANSLMRFVYAGIPEAKEQVIKVVANAGKFATRRNPRDADARANAKKLLEAFVEVDFRQAWKPLVAMLKNDVLYGNTTEAGESMRLLVGYVDGLGIPSARTALSEIDSQMANRKYSDKRTPFSKRRKRAVARAYRE